MALTQQRLHLERETSSQRVRGCLILPWEAPLASLLPLGTPSAHSPHLCRDCQPHLCPCVQPSGGFFSL